MLSIFKDWLFTGGLLSLAIALGVFVVFGLLDDVSRWLGFKTDEERCRLVIRENLNLIIEQLCEENDPQLWEAFFVGLDAYRGRA
jgi:hypothetical protein